MVATYEQHRHSYPVVQEREREHLETVLGYTEVLPGGENRPPSLPIPDAARFVSVYGEMFRITRQLDDPDLTRQLKALIEESARSLASVETCFAVDGTAFGYDDTALPPWGAQYHLACGSVTGIVAAVETGDDGGSRLLPELLRTVRTHFPEAVEVCAGRAYLSKAGFEAAEELGLTLLIPFRADSDPGDPGQCPAWDRALDFYRRRHQEFLRRYRRYSVAGDVLDTIEAESGVWTCVGTDRERLNTALIKMAAHNIRVVAEWTD